MPTTWFITGTSRGIGLELTKQLLSSPENTVIASCRNPDGAQDLHELTSSAKGKLHVVKLDVSDEESITAAGEAAKAIVGETGIDYIINNAGVNVGDDSAFNFTPKDFVYTMQNNVIGPALISQALLPLLEKGKKKVIMNTTSGLASIGLAIGPKCASYSISKAALNMLTYKQASLRPDLIAFVLDPGWVKTKMGGEGAVMEIPDSVSNILKVLHSATSESSGKFFRHDGSTIPW